MAHDDPIYTKNSLAIRVDATDLVPATWTNGPYTGATLIAYFAAAENDDAPIHAALQVTLTEIAATGVYTGELSGSALRAHLEIGAWVWFIIRALGTDDVRAGERRLVASRPIR